MSVRLFGTDGMRGRVNKYPMTPEVALRLGLAAGTFYRDKNRRSRVVIGKDTRLSGYVFENALAAGLLAAGMDVFLVGPLPTPAISFLTTNMRADVGVVISVQSPNPNGLNNGVIIPANTASILCLESRILTGIIPNPRTPAVPIKSRTLRVVTSCISKTVSPRTCPLKGCGWSLTAPMAPTIGSRRWPLRSWAPKSLKSVRSPTG